MIKKLEEAGLADLADLWGLSAASLAVAWVMARGVCPIISAQSAQQLAASLAAPILTDEMEAAITALSTAPSVSGGPRLL